MKAIWVGSLLLLGLVALAGPLAAQQPLPVEIHRAYTQGIQEELAAHGYDPGPADGVLNPRTQAAIRAYQRDAGLPPTGEVSHDLLNHLKFAQPPVYRQARSAAPAPTEGLSRRQLVERVQENLADRGYYTGRVDGIVGPKTREAVRLFQADAGLPVTGEVDAALLDYLVHNDPGLRLD